MMELSDNAIKGLDRITAIADIIFNDPKTPWNKDRALMIQRLVEAIKKGEDLHDPAD
jgi:benzoyl-CoA reductase/2-hydroxyglutaryl-CoA dehydratase subunit BcrC/BadD/HgdB